MEFPETIYLIKKGTQIDWSDKQECYYANVGDVFNVATYQKINESERIKEETNEI